MRQARVRLVHADEAELFPIGFRGFEVRLRQADFQEMAAGGILDGSTFARRKSACLEESDEVSRRIEPTDLVEDVIAQTSKLELHAHALERIQGSEQIGSDEGDRKSTRLNSSHLVIS